MAVTRRGFLWLGLGTVIAGCAEKSTMRVVRPGPAWPETPPPSAPPTTPSTPPPAPPPAAAAGPIYAIPRDRWTRVSPVPSRLNPLGQITRITVHHEGSTAVWFTDEPTTAQRLDLIRRTHVEKGWADIGYHYVIDRAGRVWQGRDLRYQGAHVKSNNENNLGVMCLGNFDTQAPTNAQLATLRATLADLVRYYRLPVSRIYTHQELMPTACPGKALQPQMVALRRRGQLA